MAQNTIHFCLGWGPWPGEPFLDLIEDECADRRLTCVVCRDANLGRIIDRIESGRARVLFHFDCQADYEDATDPYARLGYAAKDSGAFVLNEPDVAKAANHKAVLHYQLVKAGIPVPYSVVVRNWEPAKFKLAPNEKRRLGKPFVVKPARGYGKVGVSIVRQGSIREIARARRFDRGDDFIIQEFIDPAWFGHHMGWFRVFYLLGEVFACFWDTVTQHYTPVSLDDFERYDLTPLVRIARDIARVTHMNYFSTEIAVTGKGARRRFVVIDYVNDQCDMTMKSMSHCGVPDMIVERVATRLVDAAARVARNEDPHSPPRIWFLDAA